MLLKQTKIVATISDQRCDVDFIKQLFDAGLNVVRMNTAHAGREGFEKLIANVRTVSNRIAILMDTKGPEVRTTVLDEPIPFKAGDRVKVVGNPDRQTTRECISVSYPNLYTTSMWAVISLSTTVTWNWLLWKRMPTTCCARCRMKLP